MQRGIVNVTVLGTLVALLMSAGNAPAYQGEWAVVENTAGQCSKALQSIGHPGEIIGLEPVKDFSGEGDGYRVRVPALGQWTEVAYYDLYDDDDPAEYLYVMTGTSGDSDIDCNPFNLLPCTEALPVAVEDWMQETLALVQAGDLDNVSAPNIDPSIIDC